MSQGPDDTADEEDTRNVRLARAYRCNRGSTGLTLTCCAHRTRPGAGFPIGVVHNADTEPTRLLHWEGHSHRGQDVDEADVLVIFGGTGDLAKMMTFQALYRLARNRTTCPIVRVAADHRSVDDLRKRAQDSIGYTRGRRGRRDDLGVRRLARAVEVTS